MIHSAGVRRSFQRRRSRRGGAARRAGFTLIEISVVILILALMLTGATVKLDAYLPGSRSESAARQFLSTLDLARTSAVAYARSYVVEIDLEGDRYRIVTPLDEQGKLATDPEQRFALPWEKLATGVHFEEVYAAGGAAYDQGVYTLAFHPSGSAEELYVHFGNDAGEGYALTAQILALTGASKILQGRILPVVVTEDAF